MASLGVEVVILMDQRVLLVLRDDFNVWALPGGGVDPNESLVQAAMREVREETGVESALVGVVSMRHLHGVRFGQSDLYVVVKLRATTEEIKMDAHELAAAKWMTRGEIESRLAAEGEARGDIVSLLCAQHLGHDADGLKARPVRQDLGEPRAVVCQDV